MNGLIAHDQMWTAWINQHHSALLDGLLVPVALSCEAGVAWLVTAVAFLAFGNRRLRLVTLVFLGVLIATEAFMRVYGRTMWERPRPYMYMEAIRQIGVAWKTTSFPSAHAYLWVEAALVFGAAYPRFIGGLLILTALTLYSRPYCGMHHVLDVGGGVAMGLVFGLPGVWLLKRLRLGPVSPPRPPEAAEQLLAAPPAS